MPLAGTNCADVVGAERRILTDEGTRERRVDHLAATDVDADVVNGRRIRGVVGEEDEVAGLQLRLRYMGALMPLVTSEVLEVNTGLRPDVHRQTRAVEGVWPGRTPDVGLSDLFVCPRHRRRGAARA